jgi:ribonucleoside-diphosphate reductase alpha chain
MSNYYTKNLAKHTTTIKNKHLEELLKEKKMNNRDVWNSIIDSDGSVQHLDFLSQEEKKVFKTFKEIDQEILLQQAADRQKYIDQ